MEVPLKVRTPGGGAGKFSKEAGNRKRNAKVKGGTNPSGVSVPTRRGEVREPKKFPLFPQIRRVESGKKRKRNNRSRDHEKDLVMSKWGAVCLEKGTHGGVEKGRRGELT